MFGLFKKKEYVPLDAEWRQYIKDSLHWLAENYPEPSITERKVLRADARDFPIKWNGSKENALAVLEILSTQMQLNVADIELHFNEELISEINMGGSTMYLQQDPRSKNASAYYHGRDDKGRISISLETSILSKPLEIIATLSHELSHVKLLDEKALTMNDEFLTDLCTIFFGAGSFNANASFQFYQQTNQWGYSKVGYLNQEQWSYALALFAYLRNEENPEWKEDLNKTIRKDFERSLIYIQKNK